MFPSIAAVTEHALEKSPAAQERHWLQKQIPWLVHAAHYCDWDENIVVVSQGDF